MVKHFQGYIDSYKNDIAMRSRVFRISVNHLSLDRVLPIDIHVYCLNAGPIFQDWQKTPYNAEMCCSLGVLKSLTLVTEG
jgi:hypothetical protein